MVVELAMLLVVVSSTMQSTLRCSPDETFQVEVVGKLVAKFWRLWEWCSRLELPSVRICDLLLGLLLNQARLANSLDEAAAQCGTELAAQREVDAELGALWTLAA
jgi:hypothetical protein